MTASQESQEESIKAILRFVAASASARNFLGLTRSATRDITPHLNQRDLLRLLQQTKIWPWDYDREIEAIAGLEQVDNPYKCSRDKDQILDLLDKMAENAEGLLEKGSQRLSYRKGHAYYITQKGAELIGDLDMLQALKEKRHHQYHDNNLGNRGR